MSNIWEFNILPPPVPTIGMGNDMPALTDVICYRDIIVYDETARRKIDDILDVVAEHEKKFRKPPTVIVVGIMHYRAIVAMLSAQLQMPILPELITISGVSMNIILDQSFEGCWVSGSVRDVYQREMYKELKNHGE